jgi:hypothetical protein
MRSCLARSRHRHRAPHPNSSPLTFTSPPSPRHACMHTSVPPCTHLFLPTPLHIAYNHTSFLPSSCTICAHLFSHLFPHLFPPPHPRRDAPCHVWQAQSVAHELAVREAAFKDGRGVPRRSSAGTQRRCNRPPPLFASRLHPHLHSHRTAHLPSRVPSTGTQRSNRRASYILDEVIVREVAKTSRPDLPVSTGGAGDAATTVAKGASRRTSNEGARRSFAASLADRQTV